MSVFEYLTLKPTGVHFDLGEIPVQNFSASFHVRPRDGHLHVEPSWSHQRAKKSKWSHVLVKPLRGCICFAYINKAKCGRTYPELLQSS